MTARSRVRARRAAPVLAILAVAAVVRAPLIEGQGLWTDEYFSLAMATGHGLEHAAHEATPERGDFVEHRDPRPPEDYAGLLAHDHAPAPLSRVVEAVRRSDTNPPLYYVALAGWTRVLGASDGALRGLSLAASLLTLLPLAWLARTVGGRRAVVPACVLFALLPQSVYYGTEGRMYALLLLLTTTTLALTVRFHRKGVRAAEAAAFVLIATAGLLTHHFYVFPLAAAGGWLLVHPGRARRARVLALGVLAGALVLPWYAQLPTLMNAWRVTAGWLELRPGHYDPLLTPASLPWKALISIRGPWGGRLAVDALHAAACAVPLLAALGATRARRTPRLLWAAMLVPCAGVALLDIALGTYATAVPRYALAGLPAATLLVALGLARLPVGPRVVLLAVCVTASLVGVRRMVLADARVGQPYREVGAWLAEAASPDDLVLVHSIPSGVTGVARELRRALGDAQGPAVAAWVGQLGQRTEADLPTLVGARRRVLLVEVHRVGDPAVPRTWLEEHAELEGRRDLQGATIFTFIPRAADPRR